MNEWNDDWRDKLKKLDYECYIRLCECRNNKDDVIKIASLMHCYNDNKSKGDCLSRTLQWIVDWNGQLELMDLIPLSEYLKISEIIL